MSPVADDLALALELADRADAITRARFRASDLAVSTKPDMTPVTEADRAAEEAIRSALAGARAGDAVLGEEFGDAGDAARRWIIDPIDGTINYVRGIPVWATLIALQEDGEMSVGVASAPALGRRWWAARGQGAFGFDALTGETRALQVSGVSGLEDAQFSVSGLENWLQTGRRNGLLALVAECYRTRGFGDFWAHMLVAEGVVDVALDSPGVSLWDLAVPLIILEEAGGRLSDLAGARRSDAGEGLASNGRLHDDALHMLGR